MVSPTYFQPNANYYLHPLQESEAQDQASPANKEERITRPSSRTPATESWETAESCELASRIYHNEDYRSLGFTLKPFMQELKDRRASGKWEGLFSLVQFIHGSDPHIEIIVSQEGYDKWADYITKTYAPCKVFSSETPEGKARLDELELILA
jgi:hypothetical protein